MISMAVFSAFWAVVARYLLMFIVGVALLILAKLLRAGVYRYTLSRSEARARLGIPEDVLEEFRRTILE